MKKIISFLMALSLIGGSAFADLQIDKGQDKSTAPKIFFVGRFARTNAVGTNGNMISRDRAVIWDVTSNDGKTVQYTTTSHDPLFAGIAMDNIPGSSRDTTAANDEAGDNWGRIQTWGRQDNVSFDTHTTVGTGLEGPTAGLKVSTSAVSGRVTVFRQTSEETTQSVKAASQDYFGVLLETPAVGDGVADIFIKM